MTETYAHAGAEPTLVELFTDPVVRAVMRRDRLDDEALCRAIAIARFRLGMPRNAAPLPCAHAAIPAFRVRAGTERATYA